MIDNSQFVYQLRKDTFIFYSVSRDHVYQDSEPHLNRGVPVNVKSVLPTIRTYQIKPEDLRSRPEAIKLFFMLNSAEHEIYPTHKC